MYAVYELNNSLITSQIINLVHISIYTRGGILHIDISLRREEINC